MFNKVIYYYSYNYNYRHYNSVQGIVRRTRAKTQHSLGKNIIYIINTTAPTNLFFRK